jgi:predicted dehydrogenase
VHAKLHPPAGSSAASTVRVGVVGASFARRALLPALRHVPGARTVAVASARLESARSAAEAFNVDHAYDDWVVMLAEHELDLVCVATPTDLHAPITLAALDAGASVLCEKPMALDRFEAAAMLERARDLGRIHMVDHELRFNPNRRAVRRLITDGAIGEVRHVQLVNVTTTYGDPGARGPGDWLSSAGRGGGRLGANGSHQIDLMRWWLGEVHAVEGHLATLTANRRDPRTGKAWHADADDLTTFTLEMDGGALVHALISGVARHDLGNHTRVFGSEGTIVLADEDERLLIARAGETFQDVTEHDPNASLDGVRQAVWDVSVVGLLRELVAAIAEGRSPHEGATFEDGLACQRVMDAIRLASVERRSVRITELDSGGGT